MITPSDILRQLVRRLPYETDSFCQEFSYTDLEIKEGYLKFKVQESFDLQYIVSSGIKMLNPCANVSLLGSITVLQTTNPHKFTKSQEGIDVETDIGLFKLQRVIDKTSISLIGDANGVTLIKEKLVNSSALMRVSSNVDGNVSVELINESTYDCLCEANLYSARLNITIVPTINKMIAHYSSRLKDTSKLWMYIIAGDRRTISRPNSEAGIISEAMSTQHEVIKVTTEFDLYVWFPTNTKNENARQQIDEAYSTIYASLNRCLYGQIGDKTGKDGYHCTPHSSGTSEAESIPNFVHNYKYLVLEEISYVDDGQVLRIDYYDEPISDVDFDLLIKSGDEEPQPMNIKLDELRG